MNIESTKRVDKIINNRIPPDFKHLYKLTDDFGIIQFSKYDIPDVSSGYTLDDNSRALIVAIKYYKLFKDEKILNLARIYLNFIKICQKNDGTFHNILDQKRRFLDNQGSEDSSGRALWSLGFTIYSDLDKDLTALADDIFNKASKFIDSLKAPRAKAFSILGLYWYLKGKKNREVVLMFNSLASSLKCLLKQNGDDKWFWFEHHLTYANAILVSSLLKAYLLIKNEEYKKLGLKSLDFILKNTTYKGIPAPIGQDGRYKKGAKRFFFDQQPIDVGQTVIALINAFKVTHNKMYLDRAQEWFSWFYGNNMLGIPLYDERTGGCHDGLTKRGVNKNQGAESLLLYLISHLELLRIYKTL